MLSNIQYWLETNPYAPGIVLLAVGIIIGLFGLRLYRIVLFLAGFCVGIAVGYELGIRLGHPELGLLAGLVLGCVLGGITFATYYVSIFLLGMFAGAALAYSINQDNLILIIILAAAGGVLALVVHKYVVLLGSACLGGLFVSDGIRLIISSWIDVYQSEPARSILFWSITVIAASLFFTFQWKNYRDRIEEQEERRRERKARD